MTSTTALGRASVDQFRLMSVAARLGMSQAIVSRREAEDHGIVKTVVRVPEGLHPELEERIEAAYGLSEVHEVEVPGGDEAMAPTLGSAAARLGVTLSQLARAFHRVAIVGGAAKHAAVVADLRGGWVDSLVTDLGTAATYCKTKSATPCRDQTAPTSLFMRARNIYTGGPSYDS